MTIYLVDLGTWEKVVGTILAVLLNLRMVATSSWCCLVLIGVNGCCTVQIGIVWWLFVMIGDVWCSLVLRGVAWCCVVFGVDRALLTLLVAVCCR